MNQDSIFLDLKTIPCPLNVVKCKLALEKINKKDTLLVDLDKGEPEIMVKKSLESMGYIIKQVYEDKNWIRVAITYEFQ